MYKKYTDEEVKKELIEFITVKKATKLSKFRHYQTCKSRFGGAQKLVLELGLWEVLLNNKTYNTDDTRLKYTPEFLKRHLEEYFKNPNARVSDYKYYKLLRSRFGSLQNALDKLGVDVDLQKYKKKPSPKLERKNMRGVYLDYLMSRLDGKINANFAKRTIILNEFATTKNALENLDLYCLNLLEKINTIIIKNKNGKMTETEVNFIDSLQRKIVDFANENYKEKK